MGVVDVVVVGGLGGGRDAQGGGEVGALRGGEMAGARARMEGRIWQVRGFGGRQRVNERGRSCCWSSAWSPVNAPTWGDAVAVGRWSRLVREGAGVVRVR